MDQNRASESTGVCAADLMAEFAPPPLHVLDLDKLLHRCMGNIDLVQRVLTKFEHRLPDELAELEQAVADKNAEHIARVAHRVKGTAANISAEELHRTAATITELSRAGRLVELGKYLVQLRHDWQRYLEHAATLQLRVPVDPTPTSAQSPTSETLPCASSS